MDLDELLWLKIRVKKSTKPFSENLNDQNDSSEIANSLKIW